MELKMLQTAMNVAYERWQYGNLSGYNQRDFYMNLTDVERAACLLGNLNYQVENGGWAQWWGNGYASASSFWIEGVIEQIGTSAAKKVLLLVRSALLAIDEHESERQDCNRWGNSLWDEGEDEGPNFPCNNDYYLINSQFMKDAEEWFSAWSKEKISQSEQLGEILLLSETDHVTV